MLDLRCGEVTVIGICPSVVRLVATRTIRVHKQITAHAGMF